MPSSSLRPPSGVGSKRSANLHLSGLPRFHPGNYATNTKPSTSSPFSSISASSVSSTGTSPPSEPTTPAQHPMTHNLASSSYSTPVTTHSRPLYHSRQYSDAQRKLHAHQREVMSRNYYGSPFGGSSTSRPITPTSPSAGDMPSNGQSPRSPRSPRLHPLGSPGPVTPLELEERDGYVFAGSSMIIDHKQMNEQAKEQILETFIKKEGYQWASLSSSDAAQGGLHSPKGLKRGDPTNHRSALSR